MSQVDRFATERIEKLERDVARMVLWERFLLGDEQVIVGHETNLDGSVEFVVFLKSAAEETPEMAQEIARTLADRLQMPTTVDGQRDETTAHARPETTAQVRLEPKKSQMAEGTLAFLREMDQWR